MSPTPKSIYVPATRFKFGDDWHHLWCHQHPKVYMFLQQGSSLVMIDIIYDVTNTQKYIYSCNKIQVWWWLTSSVVSPTPKSIYVPATRFKFGDDWHHLWCHQHPKVYMFLQQDSSLVMIDIIYDVTNTQKYICSCNKVQVWWWLTSSVMSPTPKSIYVPATRFKFGDDWHHLWCHQHPKVYMFLQQGSSLVMIDIICDVTNTQKYICSCNKVQVWWWLTSSVMSPTPKSIYVPATRFKFGDDWHHLWCHQHPKVYMFLQQGSSLVMIDIIYDVTNTQKYICSCNKIQVWWWLTSSVMSPTPKSIYVPATRFKFGDDWHHLWGHQHPKVYMFLQQGSSLVMIDIIYDVTNTQKYVCSCNKVQVWWWLVKSFMSYLQHNKHTNRQRTQAKIENFGK